MPPIDPEAYVVANTVSTRDENGRSQVVDDQNGFGVATYGELRFEVRETGATTGVVEAYGRTIPVSNLVTDELLDQLRNITRDGVVSVREFRNFQNRIDDVADDGLLNQSIPRRPFVGDNMGKKRSGG